MEGGCSSTTKMFLPEERLALRFNVSDLLIFNEDRLGGFSAGLYFIIVRKALYLGREPPVYIICREDSAVTIKGGLHCFL